MRTPTRWTVAITGSLAVFAASWATCRYLAGLDTPTSLAIAAAPLAVALAVLAWWAAREPTPAAPPASITQTATAAGGHSQVVTGNTGTIIGGDLRRATIHLSHHGDTPLPAARPGGQPPGPATTGDIPQQPPAYQPRDTLLAPLRAPATSPGICVIHAVTGQTGTGKTQAAAAYARQRITDKWRLVAWINADNTATTLDGLTHAAAALAIPPGEDQPATARALRHHLETHGHHCLLVFDNAPDPDTLRPYLPAAGNAHIIITTTHTPLTSLGTAIPVDVFTEPEALTYLAQRTGHDDTNGASELATELGHLPLALAQAAAVITDQRITYATYLDRTPTPCNHATTSRPPTGTRGGPPRPSPCTSALSPTSNASSAPTTPAP
jgi:hypothetical protein